MNDAERRLEIVKAINICASQIVTATARHVAAQRNHNELQKDFTELRTEYTRLFKLTEKTTVGADRVDLMNKINACLNEIEQLKPTIHKAQSESGTARNEVAKYEAEMSDLQSRLKKLLPKDLLLPESTVGVSVD